MFYTLVFDQSERAQGPIYILKADKPRGMLAECENLRDLRVFC